MRYLPVAARPLATLLLTYLGVVLLFSIWPASAQDADCDQLTSHNADHCLRLNQVQVLGTHNSYKRWPAQSLIDFLDQHREGWARDISYEHPPLTEQLSRLNIRQFELDIFADPHGGLYANPAGGVLVNDPEIPQNMALMQQPGLKVLHSQDTDFRSTCLTLVQCLTDIRDWSLQHPNHLPIMIMLELKDSPRQDWGPLRYTVSVSFDADNIYTVDEEIWQVFARSHIITPDDVRGTAATLEQAILSTGWPSLAQSRGKVLFALDNTGRHREDYLSRSAILENRALFVSAEPGHPAAAFIKMNNAIADHQRIRDYVERGYLVRTRSDVPSHEARTGDTTRRELALASGAQYVSTDYADPSPLGSDYQVILPQSNGIARCNPVSAPESCAPGYLNE
jgi:hypothetical protein